MDCASSRDETILWPASVAWCISIWIDLRTRSDTEVA